MRKIELKSETEKKKKINRLIIGIILMIVMILGSVGYAFYSREKVDVQETNKVEYNGYTFYLNNNLWQTEINGNSFVFQHLPNETNINVPLVSLLDYKDKTVYFVSENSQAQTEILRNIAGYLGRFQDACFEKECGKDLPVKNCSDSIILIRERNNTKIYKEDDCVFIESNKTEIIKTADAFLYKILGIK